MSITSYPLYAPFLNQTYSAVDTGTVNTVTAALDISSYKYLTVNVTQASGTITGAVSTVQKSVDNSTWVDSASTISAAGLSDNIQITTRYVRIKVTTQSAIASTANITIQAK